MAEAYKGEMAATRAARGKAVAVVGRMVAESTGDLEERLAERANAEAPAAKEGAVREAARVVAREAAATEEAAKGAAMEEVVREEAARGATADTMEAQVETVAVAAVRAARAEEAERAVCTTPRHTPIRSERSKSLRSEDCSRSTRDMGTIGRSSAQRPPRCPRNEENADQSSDGKTCLPTSKRLESSKCPHWGPPAAMAAEAAAGAEEIRALERGNLAAASDSVVVTRERDALEATAAPMVLAKRRPPTH